MIQERHAGAFTGSSGLTDRRLANLLREQAQDPYCKSLTGKLAASGVDNSRIAPNSGEFNVDSTGLLMREADSEHTVVQ